MKTCLYAFLMYFAVTVPAFAGVTITSPSNGAQLTSPFLLSTYASSCSSHSVQSIGYSFDASTYTAISHGNSSISKSVSASAGTHTIHVKAWNSYGDVCVADVRITITGATPQASSSSNSNISVSTPTSGQHVVSPFPISADGYSCQGRSVQSLGYSFDHGDTTLFRGQSSIDVKASTSAGTHTLKVKAWNTSGAVCVDEIPITVTQVTDDAAANSSIVPSTAHKVSHIEVLKSWKSQNDSAVSGWSDGTMSVVSSPSHSGAARKFYTRYYHYGAERYSTTFDDNRTSRNFFYDAWVYIVSPSSDISNLEFDINQTMSNGNTVIFGVQCDGWSGKWAYTRNAGSPSNPQPDWVNSSAPCNPRTWSTGKWHHVQMLYSRNDSGTVTYKYAWLDGNRETIWATVPDAFRLGWGSEITTQFQVDGHNVGNGESTVYLDDVTISRW